MIRKVLKGLQCKPISCDIGTCFCFFETPASCFVGSDFVFGFINSVIS